MIQIEAELTETNRNWTCLQRKDTRQVDFLLRLKISRSKDTTSKRLPGNSQEYEPGFRRRLYVLSSTSLSIIYLKTIQIQTLNNPLPRKRVVEKSQEYESKFDRQHKRTKRDISMNFNLRFTGLINIQRRQVNPFCNGTRRKINRFTLCVIPWPWSR